MTEPWTITALLDTTQKFLAGKGCDSPRLDAELLLAHSLKMPRLHLYLNFDRPLTVPELDNCRMLVKRRAAHEPVAYITGQKEFYSRPFKVTKDVLIPRPETEIVVETVLKKLKSADIHGFEIGLGSGCIAITLLCECSKLKMTAIEISPAAAEIALQNATSHNVAERLNIVIGDFLQHDGTSPVSPDTKKFDFIVGNPPYVASKEITTLMPDVRDHEPHSALDGGEDGLNFYRVIATRTKTLLKAQGFVAVEIGETQGKAVSAIFAGQGLKNNTVIKDYAGHDRVVLATF